MEELTKRLDIEMVSFKAKIKNLTDSIYTEINRISKLQFKVFYPLPMAKFR